MWLLLRGRHVTHVIGGACRKTTSKPAQPHGHHIFYSADVEIHNATAPYRCDWPPPAEPIMCLRTTWIPDTEGFTPPSSSKHIQEVPDCWLTRGEAAPCSHFRQKASGSNQPSGEHPQLISNLHSVPRRTSHPSPCCPNNKVKVKDLEDSVCRILQTQFCCYISGTKAHSVTVETLKAENTKAENTLSVFKWHFSGAWALCKCGWAMKSI